MNLDPFFAAKHIVIVGASSDPGRVGGRPIAFLQRLGYAGQISPVNPNRAEVAGLTCYPDVAAVPGDPELALIAVAGEAAVAAVAACGKRGIHAAIVFTAGFGEVGKEGQELEGRLLDAAGRHDVRLCGPNTLGIISAPERVAATFATSLDATETLEPGCVGLISQSGALGAFMHREAQLQQLPLRHFVATGNEVDLTAGDYLQHMVEDQHTCAVGMYLEGVRDGASLVAGLIRARELGKPVAVVKVGRGSRAKAAAQSHTGAMAGDDEAIDAVLSRYGALRVDDIDGLLSFLYLAASLPQLPTHNRLGVVSLSGGLGVWAADVAEERGAIVTDLADATRARLEEFLPGFASVVNPVDVTGQIVNEPALLARSIDIVAADSAVDAVFVGMGIQEALGKEIALGIVSAADGTTKPVIVGWMAGPEEAYEVLQAGGIPTFRSVGRGLAAVTSLLSWAGHERRELSVSAIARTPPQDAAESLFDEPTEYEAKRLLARAGIPTPAGVLVADAPAAGDAVRELGGLAVMKAQLRGVAHKTELGLVELNIETPHAAVEAFKRLRDNATAHGLIGSGAPIEVLVEQMAVRSVELILGYRRDDAFGPIITLGLGGIYAEVLRSIENCLVPLEAEDIRLLLERSRVATVLGGYRGQPSIDTAPLIQMVLRFSEFVDANQHRLTEVEINPLAVSRPSGHVVALDALVVPAR